MKQKQQFTKRQHFIPQFSIRPFEVAKGKCLIIDLKKKPLEVSIKKTADIMQEIDLYESKDSEGNYINRNEIEDLYSKFENDISKKFKSLIELLLSNKSTSDFLCMIKTNEWPSNEAALLSHIALTLIRSPYIKKLFYDNDNIPVFMKSIMYRQIIGSQMMAVEHARSHLNGEELEIALHVLKGNSDSGIQVILEHLMNNYQLEIYMSEGKGNFFLGDNPILVNKFEDIDYLIPIAPSLCLGTTKLRLQNNRVLIKSNFNIVDDNMVRKINHLSLRNARQTVIVSTKKDLDIVKQFGSHLIVE